MSDETPQLTGQYLNVGRVERIAVFRALHLGDFLCSVPAMRALKGRYPRAELTFVGLGWVHAVLLRYSFLDRFLEFPGYLGLEGIPWEAERTRRFVEEAREYRYDLAIQMHGDGSISNGFVAQLGGRTSLGYRPEGVRQCRELDVELTPEAGEHEIARWLRLVGVLGASSGPELEFPLVPEDCIELGSVVEQTGLDLKRPIVGIHPGAKEPAKRWPAERFAQVADHLAGELDAQVVITGTLNEVAIARRMAEAMRAEAFVVAGKTSLGGLAALLSRMLLVVTNDTGVSHLVAALGVPSVVLFGPTDPVRWAPLDTGAHRWLWSGPGNPISSLPVERVTEESLRLVERCASPMS